MNVHSLKVERRFYLDILYGDKDFEYRLDDRNIQVGDYIILLEIDNGCLTGCSVRVLVKYVLRNVPQYGLPLDYCVIGFVRLYKSEKGLERNC